MSGNKRYGHAIGKTNGEVGLTQTTYKSRANPLVDFAPGTKAPSEGEPYTFAMASRVFAETWRSLELLSGVLDTPAVRVDRIEAYNGTYGTNALSGLAVGASAPSFSSGTAPVVAWIYHGLYKSELSRFLKLSKSKTQADLDYADVVSPSDVIIPGLSSSVFPSSVVSQGSTFHGIPSYVAPMRRVRSLVAPYSGGELAVAIDSWETDGCRITTREWDEIYARPGVFVEVTGAGANNGLWQIAQIAYDEGTASGGKAVLVRGGLHKFTLDAPLALGSRISWSVQPNEALSGLGSNKHYGVVAYILGDDHYVLEASASEQLPVPGLGALGLNALGAAAGRSSTGHIGSIDVESGNDRNRTVVAGTVVTDSAGTTANITAVIMAREPVVFDPDSTVGAFYLVSPLGFSLSPQLVVNNSIGGDYNLDCFTLTTVGEQLLSQAGVAQGEVENPAYEQGFTRSERTLILQALKHFKAGTASATSPMDSPNGSFAPPAMVLGEQRWRVTMSNITDADTFETHVPAGTVVEFSSSVLGANKVKALVVSAQDNEVILSEVRHDLNGGFAPESVGGTSIVGQPLAAAVYPFGSYVVVAGRTFVVSVITVRPEMDNAAGGTTLPNPSLLTNLYRNLFSSAAALRTSNHGKWVLMDDGNPLELYLSATGVWQSGVRVWGSVDDYDALSARDQSSANTNHTLQLQVDRDGGVVLGTDPSYPSFYLGEASAFATPGAVTKQVRFDFAGGVLGFADQNTGLGSVIPFSEASPFNALPGAAGSVLGALTQLTQAGALGAQEYAVISPSLIYAEDEIPVVMGHSLAAIGSPIELLTATTAVSSGAGLSGGEIVRIRATGSDGRPYYEYVEVSSYVDPNIVFTGPGGAWQAEADITDWAVVSDPLQVTVKAGSATIKGMRYEWEDTNLVVGASAASFVYINGAGVPTVLGAAPRLASTAAPLATVTANAYAVTSVSTVALRSSAVDLKTDLYVGQAAGLTEDELYNQVNHFATIGEAFKAIEKWQNGGLSMQDRSWRVFIVGSCEEVDNLDMGIALPLKVPASNVRLLGSAGSQLGSSGPAVVTWTAPTALFDTNGKENFKIDGCSFAYTGSSYDGASIRKDGTEAEFFLVTDAYSATVADGLGLRNVAVSGGPGLIGLSYQSSAVSVVGCSAVGVADTGLYFVAQSGGALHLDGFEVVLSAAPGAVENAYVQRKGGGGLARSGVYLSSESNSGTLRLRGLSVDLPFYDAGAAAGIRHGITVDDLDGAGVVIADSLVTSTDFLSTGSSGEAVRVVRCAGAAQVLIKNVEVLLSQKSTSYGFRVLSPRVQLRNCTARQLGAGVNPNPLFSVEVGGATLSDCYAYPRADDASPFTVSAVGAPDPDAVASTLPVRLRACTAVLDSYNSGLANAGFLIADQSADLESCRVEGSFSSGNAAFNCTLSGNEKVSMRGCDAWHVGGAVNLITGIGYNLADVRCQNILVTDCTNSMFRDVYANTGISVSGSSANTTYWSGCRTTTFTADFNSVAHLDHCRCSGDLTLNASQSSVCHSIIEGTTHSVADNSRVLGNHFVHAGGTVTVGDACLTIGNLCEGTLTVGSGVNGTVSANRVATLYTLVANHFGAGNLATLGAAATYPNPSNSSL